MILGANHIAISVPDLDRALSFYRDLLGFKPALEFGWEKNTSLQAVAEQILAVKDTAARVVMLQTGNLLIEIFEFSAGNPKPQDPNRPVVDHGLTHLCLAVKGLDQEYQRLSAAGMKFHSEPIQIVPGVRTVYGRDPFGNVIELEEVEGRDSAFQPAVLG